MKTSEKQLIFFLATEGEKYHYTWIKNLNRLLYDQTKHEHRKYFCERSLHGFKREDLLEKHTPDCRGINQASVAIEMPEPGEKIMFNNYRKQLKAPYIIYADFESIIHKIQGPNLDPKKS